MLSSFQPLHTPFDPYMHPMHAPLNTAVASSSCCSCATVQLQQLLAPLGLQTMLLPPFQPLHIPFTPSIHPMYAL